MKSLQEAYNSIYIQEEFIEIVDVFECAYITLVENGMSEDDATEVVNHIYEHLDEIQELEQDLQEDLNENAAGRLGLTLLGGVARMLNFLPKKKGVQRLLNMPRPKLPSQLPTMQSVVKKTTCTYWHSCSRKTSDKERNCSKLHWWKNSIYRN